MKAEDVFLAAVEKKSPAERAAFLDGSCAGNPDLRAQVEGLINAHENAGSFLEQPLFESAPTTDSQEREHGVLSREAVTVSHPAEAPGTVIGPYKLLQQIGEGGMGTVYMAEQTEPVHRKVALKIIKDGLDSRQIIARFEAERQALALMDHPNIARVFDAGTIASGRPYFVMELVKGLPITKHSDEHHLTPRQRLELFIPVCQAVQHAHQKGIIHRDLKPSNVLVAQYDGKPVPKVIDFGVAKAAGPKLTDRTLYTEFGAVVGTFEYMSPEQAELNQLDVDTRSDIYSLGVLLYELLTGTTPLERSRVKEAALLEVLRLIREEEPPKPSTRLSELGRSRLPSWDNPATVPALKVGPTSSLASISALRQTEPAKLTKLMRGELDWIVMKALEKDRNRRYETANGLAMDIHRYLADEPVQACPPSAVYRFRKFARRNKLLLTSATIIFCTLLAATTIVAWKWQEEQSAKNQALAAGEEAKEAEKRATTGQELAVQARREARLREAEALAGQAHGIRLSRRSGQRFEALDALGKAAAIGRELGQPPAWFDRLRNEAIAALALPDIHITKTANFPPGSVSVDLDADFEWYSLTDQKGACSIRQVADNRGIARLPEMGEQAEATFGSGRVLAVRGATSGRLQLWDLSVPEKPVSRLQVDNVGHTNFNANGSRLAVSHQDGAISVFDVATGRRTHRLPPGDIVVGQDLRLHPTEPFVATFSYFVLRLVQIRDLRTGAVVASALCPWPSGIGHAAWSPDGRTLTVPAGDGGKIQQFAFDPAAPNLRPVRPPIDGPDVGGATIVYNPAGDRFISRGWSNTLHLFEEVSGRLLFSTPSVSQGCLRFDRTGQRLASAHVVEHNDQIGLYSVAAGREYRTLLRSGGSQASTLIKAGAIHPGGRLVALGSPVGGGMALFDLESGRGLAETRFPMGSGTTAFDGAGNLFTNSLDGLFRWPVRTDPSQPNRWTVGPPERLPFQSNDCPIAASQDGEVIAQCAWINRGDPSGGGWILHPNCPTPRCVEPGSKNFACCISPDGRLVAFTQDLLHPINVYETATRRRVWQSPANCGYKCCFSRDCRWLVTDVEGGRLYKVGTWEPGPQLGAGQPWDVTDDLAAFVLPNGVYRLVELANGRELARLEDPEQITGPAAFTPDGTKLIVTGRDGLHIWDLRAIRRELARLGLDWGAPAYPPLEEKNNQPSLEAVVDVGSLAGPEMVIAKYSVAVALLPLNPEAYLHRGRAWCALQRWREAADDLGLAVALDPRIRDAQVWFELGHASAEVGRVMAAMAAYSRCIELNPQGAFAWNNRGNAYLQLEQWDKAVADFSRAIELKSRFATAWTNRGYAHCGLKQWDKALVDLSKAIELDPKLAAAWSKRGEAYLRLEQWDKALVDLSKAIDLDRNNVTAFTNRSAAYGKLGQWDKALADSSKAIELDRNNAPAFNNRGVAYANLGQWDKALADYAKAIDLGPRDPGAWFNRGEAYLRLEQWDKALADLSTAIELDPKFALAWNNRGMAYLGLKQGDMALAAFSKAIELEPKNATLHNNQAWLLATYPNPKVRDPGRAVELAKKAVEMESEEGNYWNTLGVAHCRAGNWKAAIAALEKSMSLRKGGDAFDYVFLAMAHQQLVQKEEARKWYEKTIDWMQKNQEALKKDTMHDEELLRFRAEAEELMKKESGTRVQESGKQQR
jgi:tetratricopeptide (TPR) repeat protein/serine/threonine protein kinase/WD40 repeat protein